MDDRTLRSFLCLAETLHFGRAASARHMSVSTLSRSIRQLEQRLGARLFLRDNRSVRLTGEGRLFRRYARESLALFESLQNSLLDQTRELTGEISMYCSVTASYSFLFSLLDRFRARHPRIRIKLQTGDPEQALARVHSGDAQIGIGARPARLPAAITFKRIAATPLVFIAPRAQSPVAALPARSSAIDWNAVPMIVPESGVARDRIDQWFRDRQAVPRIWAQVAGNEAIVSMVSLGDGVGIVPRIVLKNSPLQDRVRALRVTPELAPLDVGLFVLQRGLDNRLVAALWDAAT